MAHGLLSIGPLTAATEGSFLADALGGETIPISQTVFSSWNLLAAAATILVVGLALFLIAPRSGDKIFELEVDLRETVDDGQEKVVTPADRLDASRIVTLLIGLLLVTYLVLHFSRGGTLTLDTVNWSFLTLIMLLVRNPFELIALTKNAAANVGEILLQFPLYAGILGLMTGSGLVQIFSDFFVSISNPITFGVFAFLAAGLVNFLSLWWWPICGSRSDHAFGRL